MGKWWGGCGQRGPAAQRVKTTRVLLRVLLLKEVSEDILYREEKLLEGASENSLIRWINSRRNHCQLSLIELYLKHKDDILYVTTVLFNLSIS